VGNVNGLIHTEREVDIEVRTATSVRQTRADYVFRHARVERFTCEAKKPAEALHDRHIYQAKRDAFARGIPVALLSDFEHLKIYIVGARPHRDEPHVGEFKSLQFREYPAAAARALGSARLRKRPGRQHRPRDRQAPQATAENQRAPGLPHPS